MKNKMRAILKNQKGQCAAEIGLKLMLGLVVGAILYFIAIKFNLLPEIMLDPNHTVLRDRWC